MSVVQLTLEQFGHVEQDGADEDDEDTVAHPIGGQEVAAFERPARREMAFESDQKHHIADEHVAQAAQLVKIHERYAGEADVAARVEADIAAEISGDRDEQRVDEVREIAGRQRAQQNAHRSAASAAACPVGATAAPVEAAVATEHQKAEQVASNAGHSQRGHYKRGEYVVTGAQERKRRCAFSDDRLVVAERRAHEGWLDHLVDEWVGREVREVRAFE